MSYLIRRALPTAEEVLQKLPITQQIREEVAQDRIDICRIIEGQDTRKLLIIGPCSAWPDTAVVEYAQNLKKVATQVEDKLKIVMRAYTQKPRTTIGWTGPFNHPDPFGEPNIKDGIFYVRKMMVEIAKIGLPMADEAVFTHNDGYVVDLLSWIAIGARSTEDQEHRIFASLIPHPVGMKNPTSGNIQIGINSVIAAQHPHIFSMRGQEYETSGNPHAHLILRGGNKKTNFDREKLEKATHLLQENGIKNPSIVVDASHENSIDPETGKKDPLLQPEVIYDVLATMQQNPDIAQTVKGFMVESFLEDGNQSLGKCASSSDIKPGVSVTDGCIGWEKTEAMILKIAEKL
jgi:3-deoxy-7-phosphoheptulonate synthase